MAFLNWKTAIYMFTVILVNIWVHVADSLLIVRPENTQVLVGQIATLNCSTSLTEDVHWYYGTSYVYAGMKLYSPYKDRLKIEVYQNDVSTGTAYNLVFPSANPEDAGMYNCRDNQGSGETSSAEITVFTPDGNGTCRSNMKPDGIVIPNDCNIDPDVLQLSCSVTFYGKYPPQLEWKEIPDNGNNVAKTECQTIDNRIVCNSSIIADRQMHRYVCQTTWSSKLNIISLCTTEGKHLIYAFNGQTATISSVGNDVQCNPDTSQSCNYKWKHSGIAVSISRTVTPDKLGLYQCEADCNIRGKRCIVFDYAYISDDDSASSSTGYIVGICVLVLLLVITISTSIYFFLINRGKGRLQRLRNRPMHRAASQIDEDRDMMSLENESQRDRTPLIQPHQEMETILDEPKLTRTLIPRAASSGNKAVFGLTILGDELFVLCYEWLEIEVFADLQILQFIREVSLIGHELEFPWDIQSSPKNKCLYIVDKKKNEKQQTEIIKIDPKGFVLAKWKTECKAGRLSVTQESNVIVTSLYDRRIREYSPDGDLIRFLDLPSEIVSPAWVTMKRSTDEYIISYGNKEDLQHGVCVSDQNGNIKYNFDMKKGPGDSQPCVPVHMAAFCDGHALVADKDNHRVVMLSTYLKFPKALFSRGDRLRLPNRLCLDELNKRLFVSDNRWISNMKPWNDGRVLVFDMSSVQASFNFAAESGHQLTQNLQSYGSA